MFVPFSTKKRCQQHLFRQVFALPSLLDVVKKGKKLVQHYIMKMFDWTIVGAGPAGIAAVGKLLDRGIDPKKIAWIDPRFKVGDLGEKWRGVSSNTKVGLFIQYLKECQSFRFQDAPPFKLLSLDPENTCFLNEIADPLDWVTGEIRGQITSIQSEVTSLKLKNEAWEVAFEKETIQSKNVILAIGSEPKRLNFPRLEEIPVSLALDPYKLQEENLKGEKIAVFGASHSSMIVLRNLLEMEVDKVINFYTSPLRFAVYFDDWILFDNTGLKGESAAWARKNIQGSLPDKLSRCHIHDEKFQSLLKECTKVVYTVGFEPRTPPETPQFLDLKYNDRNGIIAPGLFGLGIAYPQRVEDPLGNEEHAVGLWKFMKVLDDYLPLWMRYAP